MGATQVTLKIAEPLATATFHTEGGLNVLSSSVLDRIAEVAAEIREAKGVRALVVGAAGKVFIAGADIKELSGLDAAGAKEISERGNRAFDALADLPCVTIARIQGAALGGGLEVAMSCDFRVAVHGAKLGLVEAALGLVPGWKGVERLSRLVGVTDAKRLLFSAGSISADVAHRHGLVDEVAEDEAKLDEVINEMVKQFRKAGPHAIAMVKETLRTGDGTKAFADCFAHPESREGIEAFLSKRSPSWA